MATAPNIAAIKKYIAQNRPDMDLNTINAVLTQDAFILVAALAFDAGRVFQHNNPTAGKFLVPNADAYDISNMKFTD